MMYFPALKTAAFITRRVCHRKTIKLKKSGQGSNQECTFRIHMWSPGLGPAKLFKPKYKRSWRGCTLTPQPGTPINSCPWLQRDPGATQSRLSTPSWSTSPLLQDPFQPPLISASSSPRHPFQLQNPSRAGFGAELITHLPGDKSVRIFFFF